MPVPEKLLWYKNRLALMSSSEVLYRFGKVLKSQLHKINLVCFPTQNRPYRQTNRYFFDRADLETIRHFYQNHPEIRKSLIREADLALAHEFTFFAFDKRPFGFPIDWHRDYSTGKRSKAAYYTDIDYRDYEHAGDAKYVWEINRFAHFFPLAQAFAVTADARYAEEIIGQWLHWIDENPYLMGINWTSALEHSIRLMAWGFALKTLELMEWPLSGVQKEKIATSIYQHAEFIQQHLSAYSSANNHRIGEGAGLTLAGTLFDFGSCSVKWRNLGLKLLLEELDKQFYTDGMNKEQASAYHLFSYELFLYSFLLLKTNHIPLPPHVWERMEKTLSVLLHFTDEHGLIPAFGDNDDAFVMKLSNHPATHPWQSVLNLGAVLFRRGDLKYIAGSVLDEQTLWTLPHGIEQNYAAIPAVKPLSPSILLPESGHAVFRDTDVFGWMDIGPLGYLSIAAHGHADALSFCLNYQNKEFLIDPGTYSYHAKKEWREYFRSTRAHNTLMVDQANQSQSCGNFIWFKKAAVSVEAFSLGEAFPSRFVRASHDGYLQQGIPVKHRREVVFIKNKGFIVMDSIRNHANQSHTYTLNWHFHEQCVLEILPHDAVVVNHGAASLTMQTFVDIPVDRQLLRGSLSPIGGWTSRHYDVKEPASTLVYRTAATNQSFKWITVFLFGGNAERFTSQQDVLRLVN